MGVVFEDEENTATIPDRVVENHETPILANIFIRMGVVKSEKGAYSLMIVISVLCLLISGILFSITFIRRTDNNFNDVDRSTGTYNPPAGPSQPK